MIDYWKTIPGYFFPWSESLIEYIIPKLPDSGTILELGSAYGRSTCFWAERLTSANKNYKILTVDDWSIINEKIHPLFENKFTNKLKKVVKIEKIIFSHLSKCTSKSNLTKVANCYMYNSPTMQELFVEFTKPYDNIIQLDFNIDNVGIVENKIPLNVQCIFDSIGNGYENWLPTLYNKLAIGGYFIFDKNAIFEDGPVIKYITNFLSDNNIEIQSFLLNDIRYVYKEVKYFVKTTK